MLTSPLKQKTKKALITGITGQDGSYLAELLLHKGYVVVGVTSGANDRRNVAAVEKDITWEVGSIADKAFVETLLKTHEPDELYNLASVATVAKPWDDVFGVINTTALAPLYFLEGIRAAHPHTKFFQASSAGMFGAAPQSPQSEDTPLEPRNLYGVSKVFGHSLVGVYRKDHNLFACSGILFNHESPRRGEGFVTRKVTATLAKIKLGMEEVLLCGNLESKRDWGYAKEYVEAMHAMLQQDAPGDYVLATGQLHTVRGFIEAAAQALGITISWEGSGESEVGRDASGIIRVRTDKSFYRPTESHSLVGDASKARQKLGWSPKTKFEELVAMMVQKDIERLRS